MKLSKLLTSFVLVILTCGPLAAQTRFPLPAPLPTPLPVTRTTAESSLANSQWSLTSIAVAGTGTPVPGGTPITLKFGTDGRIAGSGGCNSYGGEYREQGDSISFSRVFSTKRACVDQYANQLEQRYFAALESARRFRVAGYHLTIYYGEGGDRADGRDFLAFVGGPVTKPDSATKPDSVTKPQVQEYENLTSPVDMLASFYNAVNNRNYERAYRYWETPPSNLQDFARGYAETAHVQLIVQPPTRLEGAAGSLYAEVATVIVARQRDGSERVFAGCYVARKSNLRPTDVPKEEVWHIYRASLSPVAAEASIPKLLAQACRNSRSSMPEGSSDQVHEDLDLS